MMKIISAYGFSAVAFLAIDAVWLTLVGPKLYRPILGDLLAEKVNFTAAVAFYLIYIAGITALVTLPALREASWKATAIKNRFRLLYGGNRL